MLGSLVSGPKTDLCPFSKGSNANYFALLYYKIQVEWTDWLEIAICQYHWKQIQPVP